eukprot:3940404-Rhodomonas_salina.2
MVLAACARATRRTVLTQQILRYQDTRAYAACLTVCAKAARRGIQRPAYPPTPLLCHVLYCGRRYTLCPVLRFELAMRCPVLTYSVCYYQAGSQRPRKHVSSASCLRARYAMSGSDLLYRAMHYRY